MMYPRRAADAAAASRMFTCGRCDQLQQRLPGLLAAAARAAATPLRRTGHTHQALRLLDEARTHLTDARPIAPVLARPGCSP
ncbi:hypothetical protein ACFW9V_36805 [Streptomyces hygroscopicus]|uniref:hypothetical protein n=1 Tax=Streptomyces hygroscopicus TaxID=1912 RepID=UPI0036797261